MLDIGWPELLVLLIIALVVIGPKDLPKAMYTLGKWVRAIRRMTSQMQRQFDDAMREAELDDIKDKLKSANKYNIRKQVEGAIDPKGQIKKSLDIGEGKSVRQYLSEGGKSGQSKDPEAAADETDASIAQAKDEGERIRQEKLAALDRGDTPRPAEADSGSSPDKTPPPKSESAGAPGKSAGKTAGKTQGKTGGQKATSGNAGAAKSAGSRRNGGKPADDGGGEAPAENAGDNAADNAAAKGTTRKRPADTPAGQAAARPAQEKETVPSSSGGGE